jgi:hypothetical protein
MPKVGGRSLDQCMSICMDDTATKNEYPGIEDRQKVCYAACIDRFAEMNDYAMTMVTAQEGKYIFTGDIQGENPTLELTRGESYLFELKAAGHPFWIKTQPTRGLDDQYNEGVYNNGADNARLLFRVPDNAPDKLYYACQFHESMQGDINITDPTVEELILKYKSSLK